MADQVKDLEERCFRLEMELAEEKKKVERYRRIALLAEEEKINEASASENFMRNLESIGTLAGGIAHDFNNLLMVILGNISLAKSHSKPGSRPFQLLVDAEAATFKGKDLTRHLITFAEGGIPHREIVDIIALARDTASSVLAGSTISWRLNVYEEPLFTKADRGQIRQVLHNIVVNAKEAGANAAVIIDIERVFLDGHEISNIPDGNYIKITITDEGRGIPPENLHRIFDPYFSTKGKGAVRGTGLGLSICYFIIIRHKGHISVDSWEGIGTSVSIFLPEYKKRVCLEEDTRCSKVKKGRVLVMDDMAEVRETMGAMLSHLDYDIEFAHDGDKAVELYREEKEAGRPFDVIILDLVVEGGMDGIETINVLREMDPHVTAIISTGYSSHPVVRNSGEYGFKGVITKPCKMNELEEILERLMERKSVVP